MIGTEKKWYKVLKTIGQIFILAFLFLLSAGLMKTGAYISWVFCFGLIVLTVVPTDRYPRLTFSLRLKLAGVLLILTVIFLPFRWESLI